MFQAKEKTKSVRRYAMVLLALAGLVATAPAFADQSYESDRAYCMGGKATEPRDLCLKEAKAALADRQGKSHGGSKRHAKHHAASKTAVPAQKSASAP